MRLGLLGFTLWASSAFAAEEVRVLTYGSFVGKGSLGEFIVEQAAREGLQVKFEKTGEVAGLLGRLKVDHKRGRKSGYDFVLGLTDDSYAAAKNQKLVNEGWLFDWSPYAFIADTQTLAPANWPKDWKEAVEKLKGKVLLQDPALSTSGAGWLRAIFETKNLSLENAKKLSAGVFPSWSASYDAFLADRAPVVWSFLTSEAYHRCEEKKDRYRAIPLAGGYPVHREWLAALNPVKEGSAAARFRKLVLAEVVQNAIPAKNWMFPALASAKLPECFSFLKRAAAEVPAGSSSFTSEILQTWIDAWNL